MPVTEPEEAVHVAEHLLSLIDEKVFDTDQSRVSVEISQGVTSFDRNWLSYEYS